MRHRVVHSPSTQFSPTNSASSAATSPPSSPPAAATSRRVFSFSSTSPTSSSAASPFGGAGAGVRRSLLQDVDRIQDHGSNHNEEEEVLEQQLLPRPSVSWWKPQFFGSRSTGTRIASSPENSNIMSTANGSSTLNHDSSIPKFAFRGAYVVARLSGILDGSLFLTVRFFFLSLYVLLWLSFSTQIYEHCYDVLVTYILHVYYY
jgi:hypothetical protein